MAEPAHGGSGLRGGTGGLELNGLARVHEAGHSQTKRIIKTVENDKTKYSALPDSLEAGFGLKKQGRQNWRPILSLFEPLSYAEMKKSFPDFKGCLDPCLAVFGKQT